MIPIHPKENAMLTYPGPTIKKIQAPIEDSLHRLAFENALQANVISQLNSEIVLANQAACRLLGFSKNQLPGKLLIDFFDPAEAAFKTMLWERKKYGQASALISIVNKNGVSVICQVSSVLFTNGNREKMTITTITDMTEHILQQKNIDIKKNKMIGG